LVTPPRPFASQIGAQEQKHNDITVAIIRTSVGFIRHAERQERRCVLVDQIVLESGPFGAEITVTAVPLARDISKQVRA
jgi:hypothetical protein